MRMMTITLGISSMCQSTLSWVQPLRQMAAQQKQLGGRLGPLAAQGKQQPQLGPDKIAQRQRRGFVCTWLSKALSHGEHSLDASL